MVVIWSETMSGPFCNIVSPIVFMLALKLPYMLFRCIPWLNLFISFLSLVMHDLVAHWEKHMNFQNHKLKVSWWLLCANISIKGPQVMILKEALMGTCFFVNHVLDFPNGLITKLHNITQGLHIQTK
jgi:hypothetical protein